MESISSKILEKIKNENIKPKPRWEFLLKEYVIWFFSIISVIVGSLAIAVIIFLIQNDQSIHLLKIDPFKKLLYAIPYFWIILLAIFLVISFFNLKHTKSGYRFNPYTILIISILASIILGSVIYAFGGGEKLEEIFYRRVPVYKEIVERRGKLLLNQDEEILAGVIFLKEGNILKLESFDKIIWDVNIENIEFIPPQIKGLRVIFHGKKTSEHEFRADSIRPFIGKGFQNGMVPPPPPINERNNFRPAY